MKPGAKFVSRAVAWWSTTAPWSTGTKPSWLVRVEAWFLGVKP